MKIWDERHIIRKKVTRKSIFRKAVSKGGSLWAAAVRSTAIFTPSPEGRGTGGGQLYTKSTMKDNKIDFREKVIMILDIA